MHFPFKNKLYTLLRWSEQYAKTDMIHFFSSNVWINVSRFISVGTGMVLTVAFANLLSPEVFGTYKYVIASAGFIASFSLNGLSMALMRAVAQGKKHVVPAIVRTSILWSLPASLASLGVSIYYFGNHNSELGFAFLFIALVNSISNGIGTTKGIFQATSEFRLATLSGIPRILVPFFIILITILLTQNVVLILLAYFTSSVITSWIYYRWTLKRLDIHGSQEDVADTVRYGKQMSILGFFQLVGGQIDLLLLWHFATPATLAIYALALSPVNEARNLLSNFFSIAFPKIAAKDEQEVRKAVPLRFKQLLVVSVIVTALYIALVPFLFTYLFPKYQAAVVVSQVFALTLLLQPRGIFELVITLHGKVNRRFRAILISQAFKLVFLFSLIPFFGLWGAVWATVLSEVGTAVAFYAVYRITRHRL